MSVNRLRKSCDIRVASKSINYSQVINMQNSTAELLRLIRGMRRAYMQGKNAMAWARANVNEICIASVGNGKLSEKG